MDGNETESDIDEDEKIPLEDILKRHGERQECDRLASLDDSAVKSESSAASDETDTQEERLEGVPTVHDLTQEGGNPGGWSAAHFRPTFKKGRMRTKENYVCHKLPTGVQVSLGSALSEAGGSTRDSSHPRSSTPPRSN